MNLINNTDTYKKYLKTKEDSFLIPLTRSMLYGRFKRLGEKHGFDISFHDLRHLSASVMLMLNIPDKYAMERGGRKTPHIMKSVYQHTFSSERKIIDEKVNNFFESLIENKD